MKKWILSDYDYLDSYFGYAAAICIERHLKKHLSDVEQVTLEFYNCILDLKATLLGYKFPKMLWNHIKYCQKANVKWARAKRAVSAVNRPPSFRVHCWTAKLNGQGGQGLNAAAAVHFSRWQHTAHSFLCLPSWFMFSVSVPLLVSIYSESPSITSKKMEK